jgi:hypothetical protein
VILQWITHACYADILKKTLQEATIAQPRLQAIQLYPVCDVDSGHFLILATGWDKQRWIDTILFHARLASQTGSPTLDRSKVSVGPEARESRIPHFHALTSIAGEQ